MINSRDSYTEYNPNSSIYVEIPFKIGEVVELNENPDVLARITQYRITVDNYKQVITVGLTNDINSKERNVDFEISSEELLEKWKKTERLVVGRLDPDSFIHIPDFSAYFDREKKLELTPNSWKKED